MFVKRIFWRISLLLFLSFFIFLVFLEVYLRIRGFKIVRIHTLDKITNLVVMKPGVHQYVNSSINPCVRNQVRVNNFGFHSCRDYVEEKPKDVYRIVVLGDSFVEALQVPCDKTFHYILERKLNEELLSESVGVKRFEVINFGISGGGRLSPLLYLVEYGAKFKPDMVIDLFVYNDVKDDNIFFLKNWIYPDLSDEELLNLYRKGDYEIIKHILAKVMGYNDIGPLKERIKFYIKDKVFSRFASLRFMYTLYSKYKTMWWFGKLEDVNIYEGEFGVFRSEYDDYTRRLWLWEEELIKRVADYSDKIGARYVLVSATEGYIVHDSIMKRTPMYDNPGYDIFKKEKELERISREVGIEYIPLVYEFRERAKGTEELTVFECDGHWNEIGHRWAAEIIFERLKILLGSNQ